MKSERQKMLALCAALNASRDAEEEERRRILRELFGAGGDSVWMQPPFYCDVCPVRIGSFTLFGPAVQILTPLHPFNAELRRRQECGKPIEMSSVQAA